MHVLYVKRKLKTGKRYLRQQTYRRQDMVIIPHFTSIVIVVLSLDKNTMAPSFRTPGDMVGKIQKSMTGAYLGIEKDLKTKVDKAVLIIYKTATAKRAK